VSDAVDHEWWSWLWTTIEHAAFVGLILALAIEFAALKLAEPHKKAIEDAKDLKIAELNNETAKLRAALAPREISASQCEGVVNALSAFAGRKAAVATYASDAEGSNLGAQIIICLLAAQMDVSRGLASIMPLGGFGSGIFVSGSDSELVQAIKAALTEKAGLAVSEGTGLFAGNLTSGGADTANAKAALVVVGVKPVPIPTFK